MIYLDYNASAPLRPEARAAWLSAQDEDWGSDRQSIPLQPLAEFRLPPFESSSKSPDWACGTTGSFLVAQLLEIAQDKRDAVFLGHGGKFYLQHLPDLPSHRGSVPRRRSPREIPAAIPDRFA